MATPKPRPLPPGFSDHTFRSKSGVDLSVRVWSASPAPTSPAPFVVWTHGGAFIGGHHLLPLAWLGPGFLQRGYHLVSHSYRLGPQARIDEQLDDSVEAVEWCRAHLPSILGSEAVDIDRYVLCGESSGGTLTTLMATRLDPPPRAVVDVYGIVDFLADDLDKLTAKEGGGRKDLPPWKGEFPEEELQAFLSDRDPTNVLTRALFWNEQELVPEKFLSAYLKAEFKYTPRIRLQAALGVWKGTHRPPGALMKTTFHDEKFATDQALKDFIAAMSTLRVLESMPSYPPTAFLHGTDDVNVPLSQSQAMAKKLREIGVPVVESYEPGGKHVFDDKYTGSEIPGWEVYITPILEFVDQHVKASTA